MNPSHLHPLASLALRLSLISAAALLLGCSAKTAQDAVVDSAVKHFDRVRTGMSKQDVVTPLGAPAKRQEGQYRWEVAGRPLYSAAIEVKFDYEDRITSVARTRSND